MRDPGTIVNIPLKSESPIRILEENKRIIDESKRERDSVKFDAVM